MTVTIAVMVVASACLHPLWNLLLKGDDDRAASWWLFTVLLAAIGLIVCLATGADIAAGLDVLPLIAVSWVGQILYGLTLIRIYERGDLSAYYPIVRASPVGVAVLGFLFLSKTYDPLVLLGIGLSVFGAFWLQKQPGRRLLDDPLTLGLAVLSMLGTAVYSIADSLAVSRIEPPVMFLWVETGMIFIYLPLLKLTGHGHVVGRGLALLRGRPLRQVGAATLAYTSYALILWAYSLGGDVAAVTTTRQLSIPLSVIIGGVVLREALILRRLWASLLLLAGIVLVVWSG